MRLIDADAFKEYMRKALEETRDYYPDKGEWAEAITEQFCKDIDDQPTIEPQRWIPCSERLPNKKECKEWIDKNLGGIGYLYPCLVTRYSSINPDRTENNPYVAKHYYDGEDFVNNSEEVCSEYIIAWMPLPDAYKGE